MPLLELPTARKLEIIETFWGNNLTDTQIEEFELSTYCRYFKEQFQLARQNDDPQCQIYTLQTIRNIVGQLQGGKKREEIKTNIAAKFVNYERQVNGRISNAIDLSIRLWLMVHIGNGGVTGQTAIAWEGGCLEDVLEEHFRHQQVLTDSVKLEKVFNALNLERIAGVIIQWTPNLVDHLRLKEDGRKPVLNVFHYASFLNYHRN